MRQIVLRSATRPGLTRRDYWLAAGAADVVLRALDDRVELAALALGHAELREGLVEVVHERIPLRAGDQQLAVRFRRHHCAFLTPDRVHTHHFGPFAQQTAPLAPPSTSSSSHR
jgi:hypothetical protein